MRLVEEQDGQNGAEPINSDCVITSIVDTQDEQVDQTDDRPSTSN